MTDEPIESTAIEKRPESALVPAEVEKPARYFDPDGKPLELLEWADLFEHADRTIALTKSRAGWTVSTVYLGLDMSFGLAKGAPPLIYETMIFWPGTDLDTESARYATKEEARAGHDRIVGSLERGSATK